ncbi:Aspartate carbamoyltransferase [Fimbriiglobus ruber]|uniref:Aspartate carbamoyltransferase n=1 Tax=Fimbriiglobus ruber TaxID=1908690 RepID=A0A225DKA7_9BACT|nr:aspartate carbamoyltransferase catalytic subunit [Fimbriiglobus ruber]OWK37629.1 Aspartate carbamoyltransferase [Fimbriiglobus ruber]
MNHLLGLEDLTPAQIVDILDRAEHYLSAGRAGKLDTLKGTIVANLFYEPSTRTKISFSLAARRLGAETLDFSPSGSSTSKGESFIDTARNIEAMGIDAVVVRHASAGAPRLLTQHLRPAVRVINAGDGAHEHPTQGLLDIFTIRRARGKIAGLTVAIVGDIAHSRVARSNIHGLVKLGARVIACGPTTLVPREVASLGVEIADDLDRVLAECDVVNLLRLQIERQRTGLFPSVREYAALFGLNGDRMKRAKPGLLILAPARSTAASNSRRTWPTGRTP